MKHLRRGNFATTRTTNAGTIARLANARLFDPLNHPSNQQDNHLSTTEQPPANQPENEEGKKAKKVEDGSLRRLRLKNPKLVELMQEAREVLELDEMRRCHKRWFERAVHEPDKLRRVLADTGNKKREDGLDNPAAWAEEMWKEFK